jgi:hypothetical protein
MIGFTHQNSAILGPAVPEPTGHHLLGSPHRHRPEALSIRASPPVGQVKIFVYSPAFDNTPIGRKRNYLESSRHDILRLDKSLFVRSLNMPGSQI